LTKKKNQKNQKIHQMP